jgi:hypothetical protein
MLKQGGASEHSALAILIPSSADPLPVIQIMARQAMTFHFLQDK